MMPVICPQKVQGEKCLCVERGARGNMHGCKNDNANDKAKEVVGHVLIKPLRTL